MRYLLEHTCSRRGTASLPEIKHHTPRPPVPSHHHRIDFQTVVVDSKSERAANRRKTAIPTTMQKWL